MFLYQPMPDGGAISTLKGRINRIVENVVDEHIDDWFGATTASKSLRRRTLLSALGEAWSWYKTNHNTQPIKIAFRTGQVFRLNDDRVKQFSQCRFRGYLNEDKTPKNPFTDVSFEEAVKEYTKRNYNRKKAQIARKKKKEEE